MTPHEKQRFIRDKAWQNAGGRQDKVLWSIHDVRKLREEQLSRSSVEEALTGAELIEDYPAGPRSLPDCLVLFRVARQPVHAVVAVDEAADRILVVTVYRPDPERWDHDWRQRKRNG